MKILVYRISSIGDIVLTTPVVRCLRKQLQNAEIHYLTRKKYSDILKNNPDIDKLHLIEKSPLEIVAELKMEKFDYFIDLHRNIRSKRLNWVLHTKYSTFPKLNFRKWLLTKFKINRLPNIHIVDRYFRAVAPLGVRNDYQGLGIFVPKSTTIIPIDLPEKYIAFAIGGTFATKRYPVDLIIEFAQQSPLKLVLLGGDSEKEAAETIVQASPLNTVNACGRLSLLQSAEVIQNADVVVSNDTGMMHIAAAFKKPLVSLWGNTVPGFGMYPYYPAGQESSFVILENNELTCRPCSKLGFKECPKGHFDCMMKILPESIVAAINKLLGV
jgi:ADP-heptose:LPS heptosyltransferase